ncbi:MAG TPA: glycosyltransferase [Cyclobacteriaceae bacterium]
MRIAILTMGTQGDVQPYVILGQELIRRGHRVTVSTSKNFDSLVRSYGVDFRPVEADFQALLNSEEGKKMMKNPFQTKKNLRKWVYPMIYNALNTFYQLATESDKVIFHVKTMADYFADQFPEKMIKANVVPAIEPTREFINPIFSALRLPSFLNKLSYKLSDLGIRMMMEPVHRFRKDSGLPSKIGRINIPSIYGVSELYLNKPKDYPVDSYFTGFWSGPSSKEIDPDLFEFIKRGEPPLLITFGSMTFETEIDLALVINRLSTELHIRVIVIEGWGFHNTKKLTANSNIRVVTSAPYDKLMPHVKAVIHHGGIGTIAACIAAGKPFWACPILYPLGDQHFWASIGYDRGVAIKPWPLSKMTETIFIENVKELLSRESLYTNIGALSKKMKLENGVSEAAKLVEEL